MAKETIDQLARRLADSLPQGVRAVRDDLEQNFRTVLKSGLARLELVTREEFEVQEAVLARTRAKLEALEQRLASMEKGPRTDSDKAASDGQAAARKAAKKAASRAATNKTGKKKRSKASAKKQGSKKKRKATARKT